MMNWIHTALKDPKMYLSGQYGSKKTAPMFIEAVLQIIKFVFNSFYGQTYLSL